jgi:hypothetical protein
MQNQKYNKSWLLWVHILLGGIFIIYTIFLLLNYGTSLIEERVVSLSVALLYLFLLNKSIKLFNQQKVGGAYFLTITSFLIGIFIHLFSCVNSIQLD